ncbi:MAG: DUF4013 domain-containing protein [Eggerthellaceae bacterium]
MEKGYFSAALSDITRSPGWFSKVLRLGLLCLVPIFGIIVLYGYLYGWARDIAWNVHRPLPDRIFGNEDGNLYKRGFFILIIAFVFGLIPGIFSAVTGTATSFSFLGVIYGYEMHSASAFGSLFMGMIFSLISLMLSFAMMFFIWVGSMRTALYGTLSSGFQIGKIWSMMRYDFTGLLRIFGMYLLCMTVFVVSITLIGVIFAFVVGIVTVLMANSDAVVVLAVLSILVLLVVFVLVCMFVTVFVEALIARALGYWTRQFQVNLWGGQEDPLPFEREYVQQRQEQFSTYANPYQATNASQGQPTWQAPSAQPGQAPYQQPQQQAPYQAAPTSQPVAYPVHQAPQAYLQQAPQPYRPISDPMQPTQPGEVIMSSSATAVMGAEGQATAPIAGSESQGAPSSTESTSVSEDSMGNQPTAMTDGSAQPPVIEIEPSVTTDTSTVDAQVEAVDQPQDKQVEEVSCEAVLSEPNEDPEGPSGPVDEPKDSPVTSSDGPSEPSDETLDPTNDGSQKEK